MSKNSSVDAQVGVAWGHHRAGKDAEAVSAFEKIVQSVPNNVDAHYGLGLAQKALGHEADAVNSLQKALSMAQEMLRAIRSQMGGDDAHNSLGTNEDDRYMMLTRMIRQRLAELGVQA